MNKNAMERERRVFELFGRVAPLRIELSSIESPPTPQPDILCRSGLYGTLAFELVELIDENFARSSSDMMKTAEMLRELPSKLPGDLLTILAQRFNNPFIFLHYKQGVPMRDRERLAIDGIRHYCKSEDPEYDVHDAFESVHFNRWERGLRVEPSSGGHVSDPIMPRLRKKFEKKYTSEHPIHLLAYVEIDLRLPEDCWLPQVDTFVRDNLNTSLFSRVWIFDAKNSRIDYVQPAL